MNKNRTLLVAAVVVLVIGIGGYAVYRFNHKQQVTKKVAVKKANPACKLLTLADATKLLGDGTVGDSKNDNEPTETAALTTSECGYSFNDTAVVMVATVSIRAPKNAAGKTDNQTNFASNKPTDAQDVSGYGDQAYWDHTFGQLHILKNGTWYSLSSGPTGPSDRTLEQTKKLADIIKQNL